jgi:penicillin-binding protein 2
MNLRSSWVDLPRLKNRFTVLTLAVLVVFAVLLLRLWFLQVISNDRYRELSEKNRIRYLPVAAPRGPVYDRNGLLLIDNRPGFTIAALRQEVEDSTLMLDQLSRYLGTDRAILADNWQKGKKLPRYSPAPLAVDVGRDIVEQVQENAIDLPGVVTLVKPVRSYPYGDMGAHLFGYLGEITEKELRSGDYNDYRGGEFVGRSGLEQYLESSLRGIEGERLLEVDVKGKELRTLKTLEARPGKKVFLTLNAALQKAAEEALGDQSGAAVALDVRTGEVLCLANRPSYDPSFFARGIRDDEWLDLLQNRRHPLQNRALKGQYPPGSTFKLVTVMAALRSGLVSPDHTVHCNGKFTVGNRDFRCWKKNGHGDVDLKKAVRESCDVWFYEVSLQIGIDRIADAARDLGLGRATGYLADDEKGGLIPDQAWKKKRFKDRWYDGETVIAAIGQGYVLVTPIQLAVMTAAVANGGKVMRPYVVERVEDFDGNLLLRHEPETVRSGTFAEKDLRVLRDGLDAVVNEPHGTGWLARVPGVRVAGKTGTAQVVRQSEEDLDLKDEEIAYEHRDHALFVAYAPAEAPEIAVAVVVEHGSHGSTAAAPVARAIFAAYFQKDILSEPVDADAIGENE